jgi:hypothetical protein
VATTDGAGAATLDGVGLGCWFIVTRAPGYARSVVELTCLGATTPGTQDILLVAGAPLGGRAVDETNRTVAGLPVLVAPTSFSQQWPCDAACERTMTDAAGSWSVGPLAPGEYEVSVLPEPGVVVTAANVAVPAIDRLDLRIVEGGTIEGRVIDAVTQRPMSGAGLWIIPRDATEGPLAHTTCDQQGQFTLRTHRRSCDVGDVIIACSGYAPYPVNRPMGLPFYWLSGGQRLTLDVRAQPAATLRGLVATASGPVAGLELTAWMQSRDGPWDVPLRRVTTDAGGRYHLSDLPPGSLRLSIRTQRHDSFVEHELDLAAGTATAYDLTLPMQSIDVRGYVLDKRRCPIAEAEVVAGLGALATRTKTSADGVFTLAATQIGDSDPVVLARRPGYLPSAAFAHANDPVEFRLTPVAAIHGRVVTTSGTPVAGAYIKCYGYTSGTFPWDAIGSTVTDHDGRFSIQRQTGGSVEVLVISPSDGRVHDMGVTRDTESPLDIMLSDPPALAGCVVFAGTSEPIAGLSVSTRVFDFFGGHRDTLRAITDGSGHFRIDHAPAEDFVLLVSGERFLTTELRCTPEGRNNVVIEMIGGATVNGIVELTDGSPLPGAAVWLDDGASVSTTAEGKFFIHDASPGEHTLHASCSARGVLPGVATARAGAASVRIVLQPGRQIEGTVRDTCGAPLAARVFAASESGGALSWSSAKTDDRGEFAIGGLRDTRHVVSVGAIDFVSTELHGVQPGGSPLSVVLDRGLVVAGVLIAPDGSPVADRTLRLSSIEGKPRSAWGVTDAAGRFSIGGLTPGRYRPEIVGSPETIEVPADTVADAGAMSVVIYCRARRGPAR